MVTIEVSHNPIGRLRIALNELRAIREDLPTGSIFGERTRQNTKDKFSVLLSAEDEELRDLASQVYTETFPPKDGGT